MRISIRHRDEVLAIVQRRHRRVAACNELQELRFERSTPETERLTSLFWEQRMREITAQAGVDQARMDALRNHYGVTQKELEDFDTQDAC